MTSALSMVPVAASVLFVLIYAPNLDHWGSSWLAPWAHVVILGALTAAWALRKVSPWLALLTACVLVNAAYSFAYPYPGMQFHLDSVGNGAYSIAAFGAVVAASLVFPVKEARAAMALAGLCIAVMACALEIMGYNVPEIGLLIGNSSMSGSTLACAFPFMLMTRPRTAFDAAWNVAVCTLTIGALVSIGQVIPWACLAAAVGAAILRECPRARPYVIAAAIVALTTVVATWDILQRHEALNDSGRLKVWAIGFARLKAAPLLTQLFGYGMGSTQVNLLWWFPPNSEKNAHDYWCWFHSEAVQSWVELGTVGASIVAAFAYDAARKAWQSSTRETAALAAIAVFCCANWPMRHAFTALMCGVIVIGVLRANTSVLGNDTL